MSEHKTALEMSEEEFRSAYLPTLSIGGSSVAAVMGINEYQTPLQVWERLMGVRGEEPDNDNMRRGRALEDDAIAEFEVRTGRRTFAAKKERHKRYDWLHGTVDRLIHAGTGNPSLLGPGVLEAKVPRSYNFARLPETGVPGMYFAQMQQYMAVWNLSWGSYAALNADSWEMFTVDVPRDETFITRIIDETFEWWGTYVVTRTPPSEGKVVGSIAPPKVGADQPIVTVNGDWIPALEELKATHQAKSRAEKAFETAKAVVQKMMNDAEHAAVQCPFGKVTWYEGTRRSFSPEKLATAHPELDLTEFYEQKVSRTFLPKFG